MNELPEVHSPMYSKNTWRWAFLALLALIIIIGAIIVWKPGSPLSLMWGSQSQNANEQPGKSGSTAASSFSPPAGVPVLENGHTVVYVYFTGHAFVPSEVVVTSGDIVRFVNAAPALTMRVGSRPEALSSVPYSSLTEPDAVPKKGTYDLTFLEPGIWSYENLSSKDPRILGVVYVR